MNEKIDAIDVKIISILMQDGRMSVAEITRKINEASERAIHYRIERLIQRGVIRIGTIVNPYALGHTVRADILFVVTPGSVIEVAEKLTKFEQVSYVACSLGNYDVISTVTARDNTELYKFQAEYLARVPGVKEMKTVLVPIFIKDVHQWFQSDLRTEEFSLGLNNINLYDPPLFTKYAVDREDQAIVDLLIQDGRIPATEIAHEIGYLSPRFVRDRIESLTKNKVIHICAIVNPISLGFTVVANVIMDIKAGYSMEIAKKLATFNETSYVGLSLEKPSLSIQICARNVMELYSFVIERLRKMPGIMNSVTSILPKTLKDLDDWRIPNSVIND